MHEDEKLYSLRLGLGTGKFDFVDDSKLEKEIQYKNIFKLYKIFMFTKKFFIGAGLLFAILAVTMLYAIFTTDFEITNIVSLPLFIFVTIAWVFAGIVHEEVAIKIMNLEGKWKRVHKVRLPDLKEHKIQWRNFYISWKQWNGKKLNYRMKPLKLNFYLEMEVDIILYDIMREKLIAQEQKEKATVTAPVRNLYEGMPQKLRQNFDNTTKNVKHALQEVKASKDYLEDEFTLQRTLDEHLPKTLELYSQLHPRRKFMLSSESRKFTDNLARINDSVDKIMEKIDDDRARSFNAYNSFLEETFSN